MSEAVIRLHLIAREGRKSATEKWWGDDDDSVLNITMVAVQLNQNVRESKNNFNCRSIQTASNRGKAFSHLTRRNKVLNIRFWILIFSIIHTRRPIQGMRSLCDLSRPIFKMHTGNYIVCSSKPLKKVIEQGYVFSIPPPFCLNGEAEKLERLVMKANAIALPHLGKDNRKGSQTAILYKKSLRGNRLLNYLNLALQDFGKKLIIKCNFWKNADDQKTMSALWFGPFFKKYEPCHDKRWTESIAVQKRED